MKQVCPVPPRDSQRRKGHKTGRGRLRKDRKRGKQREYPSLQRDLFQRAQERIRRLKTGLGLIANAATFLYLEIPTYRNSTFFFCVSMYSWSSSWGANKRPSTPNRICIIASSGFFFPLQYLPASSHRWGRTPDSITPLWFLASTSRTDWLTALMGAHNQAPWLNTWGSGHTLKILWRCPFPSC